MVFESWRDECVFQLSAWAATGWVWSIWIVLPNIIENGFLRLTFGRLVEEQSCCPLTFLVPDEIATSLLIGASSRFTHGGMLAEVTNGNMFTISEDLEYPYE